MLRRKFLQFLGASPVAAAAIATGQKLNGPINPTTTNFLHPQWNSLSVGQVTEDLVKDPVEAWIQTAGGLPDWKLEEIREYTRNSLFVADIRALRSVSEAYRFRMEAEAQIKRNIREVGERYDLHLKPWQKAKRMFHRITGYL